MTVSLLGELVRGNAAVRAGDGETLVELPMAFDEAVVPGQSVLAGLRLLGGDDETPAEQPVSIAAVEPG
ncbi:hypothetical protein [Catenulispora yoronensis]|uniref:hypothetical protein n=1 Tax=Catenulispora yoronensis TaxID=450799 RepID=UPI0031D4DE03